MHRFRIARRIPAGPLFRSIGEICQTELKKEQVVRVPGAKVVMADYRALLHDFPHLRSREFREEYKTNFCGHCADPDFCPDAIDAWLVANAAVVSSAQAQPNSVNSPFKYDPAHLGAYRPPGYGRALVVPVTHRHFSGAGLLDVKGAGVAPSRVPSHDEHSSGLEYLGVAIADFIYGWIIERIFARTVPGYTTVPVYAVIDLGFDIVGGWHGTAPAGIHVRRAHRRAANGYQMVLSGSDAERVQLQIEMLLRMFGLTSTNPGSSFTITRQDGVPIVSFGGKQLPCDNEGSHAKATHLADKLRGSNLELLNIQLTEGASWAPKAAQMYDFGHISARRSFDTPFATNTQDTHFAVGRIVLPSDAGFLQPDPTLRVSPFMYHRHSVNALGFYFAQAHRQGTALRSTLENAVRRAVLAAVRPGCPGLELA